MNWFNAIAVGFRSDGGLDRFRTMGRTTIEMKVPDRGVASAHKTIIADAVVTEFSSDGKNLRTATAVGNARKVSTDRWRIVWLRERSSTSRPALANARAHPTIIASAPTPRSAASKAVMRCARS